MKVRKNTLLLFSKPPVPGLVKTRLTTLKDGVFTPEVASGLYHCMLFDVVEICCAALADLEARSAAKCAAAAESAASKSAAPASTAAKEGSAHAAVAAAPASATAAENAEPIRDEYELIISTTPVKNVEVMRNLFEVSGTWPRELVIIADEGASFDEHYNHSFQQTWDRGADTILSMGADMPALTKADVIGGFEALHKLDERPGGGIVLSPDQEMGVSIVGWTRSTDFDHTGVFYNQDGLTVLPAYIDKARKRNLPVLYLPPVPDVDTMADLMHNITLVEALNYCAQWDDITPPWRTADALAQMGWSEVRVPPNDLHDPRDEIDVEK